MSVINKMLQDLDRRQALGSAADAAVVRAPAGKRAGREWFWRVLGVLLAAVLVWVGWVALQLLPRKPLATDLAFRAAAEARPAAPAAAASTPAPAAPAPAAASAPAEEAKLGPALASEPLRLALELETPVQEREPRPVKPAAAPPAKPAAAAPVKPAAAAPAKPKAASPPAAAKASVDKRDRVRSPADDAETYFRRAALFLGHGRVSEAEDQLAAALKAEPAHAAARQAYVALLLEQQRFDTARRLLHEALAIDPAQPAFAFTLARLHVEQRDYRSALEVMDRAGAVAGNAEFQALRGAVLQRLGRHGEALAAYQSALGGGAQAAATTWVGYGISLEALGRKGEAAQAYRRALASEPIAPQVREYAANRARALE